MKAVVMIVVVGVLSMMNGRAAEASFAAFDKKAKAGKAVSVAFFGGSLTWGSNASAPNRTSYRGRMMSYLQDKYPTAAFRFHDAAIGGTGSDLGLFRLDRDVLSKKPDLVFLDFTANDGLDETDIETLACYEALLRRMIGKGIPVVQAFFGFKWQFGKGYDLNKVPRRRDHLKLAKAYKTGVGDLYPLLQKKITTGKIAINKVWAIDSVHPDDPGYQVFFEAVRDGFEMALREKRICSVPAKPVFSDRFMNQKRVRLVDTGLPTGWRSAKTYRTSLWYDGLASRWMGDVAMCDGKDKGKIERIKMEFKGSLIGLFGEANEKDVKVEIRIDGKLIQFGKKDKKTPYSPWTTRRFSPKGNLLVWCCIAKDLKPGKHTIEIIPLLPAGKGAQLRIESICIAGL